MAVFFGISLTYVLLAPYLVSFAAAISVVAPITPNSRTAMVTPPPPIPTRVRRAAAALEIIPEIPSIPEPEIPSIPKPEIPSVPEPILPPDPGNPKPVNPATQAKETLKVDGQDYIEIAESVIDVLTELASMSADLTTTSTFYNAELSPTETVVYWFTEAANTTSRTSYNYTQPTQSSMMMGPMNAAVVAAGRLVTGIWLGWVAVAVAVAGFAVAYLE